MDAATGSVEGRKIMLALEKCPFCGGEAFTRVEIIGDSVLKFNVQCEVCNANIYKTKMLELKNAGFDKMDELMNKACMEWNRRA